MKKTFILKILLGVSILISSCTKELDALFLDPDGSTETKIEYLFSRALTEQGAGMRIGYNPSGYYLVLRTISPWIQLAGVDGNDSEMMTASGNAINNSWSSYYVGFAPKLTEMQIQYGLLPDEEKSNYDIYMNLIKVVRANATMKMTDLYGDIPYSEAFKAREGNNEFFPKYDAQLDIYTSLLADLKEVDTYLSSFSLNGSIVHNKLAEQDILNDGDITKWRKFANSLRLRAAMRISDLDNALASSTVQDIMSSNAPLALVNADNILVNAEAPNGLNIIGGGGGLFGRAIEDSPNLVYAPEHMLNVMNGSNDPRIPYMWVPNTGGDYIGLPSSPDTQGTLTIDRDNYAYINEDLMRNNELLPGFVITAAEVNFLLAEAVMEGFISGTAKDYYDAALTESINFYYEINALNASASPVAPDTADVQAFIDASTATYDGTKEQLGTQKWIHFGLFQPREAYASYRRLDAPTLPVNVAAGTTLVVPVRITIADNDKVVNEENYNAVKAQDTPNTKVSWDKN